MKLNIVYDNKFGTVIGIDESGQLYGRQEDDKPFIALQSYDLRFWGDGHTALAGFHPMKTETLES